MKTQLWKISQVPETRKVPKWFGLNVFKFSDLNDTLASLAEENLSDPLIEVDDDGDDDDEAGRPAHPSGERAKEHAISWVVKFATCGALNIHKPIFKVYTSLKGYLTLLSKDSYPYPQVSPPLSSNYTYPFNKWILNPILTGNPPLTSMDTHI